MISRRPIIKKIIIGLFFSFFVVTAYAITSPVINLFFKTIPNVRTIDPKTIENNLFIQSVYGPSYLNLCNDYNLSLLDSTRNIYSININLLVLNSKYALDQFKNNVVAKIFEEDFSNILFLNMYRGFCRYETLDGYEKNIYSVNFDTQPTRNHIQLVYDFDPFFNVMDLLNLNISSTIYYFYNFNDIFNLKNYLVLQELNKYNYNVVRVPIRTSSELKREILKLNRTEDINIVIFNIEYLYSDVFVRLFSMTEILNLIKANNRKNIFLNISTICNLKEYSITGFNLNFNLDKFDFNSFNSDTSTIEKSNFIINLDEINRLKLLNNLEIDTYIKIFQFVDSIL